MIRGFFSFPLFGRFRVGMSVPLLSKGSTQRRRLLQYEQTKREALARLKSSGMSPREYKLVEYSFRKNMPFPTRECPFCRSTIDLDCLVCRHCRRDVATEEEANKMFQNYTDQLERKMNSENRRRWIISGVVIAGIILALSSNKEKQASTSQTQAQSTVSKPQAQTTVDTATKASNTPATKATLPSDAPGTKASPPSDTPAPKTSPPSDKPAAKTSPPSDKSRPKAAKPLTDRDQIKGLY
jgi:hypothetical protein